MQALRAVPDGVSPGLVAAAAVSLLAQRGNGPWHFARTCRSLPEPAIDAVLVLLADEPHRDTGIGIFLREAMRLRGELPVAEAWQTALLAVLDLTSSYAWGSKQLKAKFRALADDPRMLAAIQAAVVGAKFVAMPLLGVLATHGGEEAADALLTVFERGRHVALERLQTHAADTPAMRALLESSAERADAAAREGPFASFGAKAWGFAPGRAHWMIGFHSDEGWRPDGSRAQSRYVGHLVLQSDEVPWWRMWLTDTTDHGRSINFGASGEARSTLPLAPCAVEALPAWLEAAREPLGVEQWARGTVIGRLRGKKLEAVWRWLLPT